MGADGVQGQKSLKNADLCLRVRLEFKVMQYKVSIPELRLMGADWGGAALSARSNHLTSFQSVCFVPHSSTHCTRGRWVLFITRTPLMLCITADVPAGRWRPRLSARRELEESGLFFPPNKWGCGDGRGGAGSPSTMWERGFIKPMMDAHGVQRNSLG